ncbi:MAG: UPF0175 family protein [Gemmatimonadetes bacterium]|jgi:predicted HTH domain antitoxin|nr:UPF0175 family protein [Gemmatimonadota bacterium]
MCVTIPDEVLRAASMSEDDLRREVALMLFGQERLTLAQASRLAGLDRLEFQQLLASRGLTVHYDTREFEADLATLRRLGRL